MKLDLFNELQDTYLQSPQGQAVFLAGVLLGYMAEMQVQNKDEIKNAPLFKQIQFGQMDSKQLKKILARVPTLLKAYRKDMEKYMNLFDTLMAKVGTLLLQEKNEELGVDGNFAFTVGFVNASEYFWKIFKKEE